MTTFKWNITTSADWNTQGAWDQGTVPNGTTANVDFLGSASYTATISPGDPAFLVDTLTLNDPNATLAQNGLLTLGGSLALLAIDAGSLVIGGTLMGGRIDALGGDVSANGGTLSGVAFEGSLDLSANNSELTLKDGTSFASAGGTGQATVNLVSQNGSTLAVLGSGTLDNATIDIGSYYNYSEILNEDTAGTGTTLTLGPNLTINETYYNAQLSSNGAAGDAIVNDGIIDVDYAGDLTTDGPGYRNNGNFVLNATNFTNAGSIAVFNDGLLDLTGRISTTVVNSIATSGGGIVGIGGTVTGGTIVAPHGEIGGLGGTLDGVSVQGSLDLSVDNSELTLKDGTKFAGIGGVGQATINLVSQGSSTLAVLGSGTLDNATIDIGSYYSDGEILNEDTAATGTTLTLGPNLTINQTYYNAQLSSTGAAGDAIVNDGIIDVDYAGDLTTNGPGYSNNGNFVLNATNFTNAGSIAVFNDGLLDLTGLISTAVVNSIATSAGGIVGIGGTVTGGTIVAPHGEIGGLGGTLDGVSVQGSLDLSVDNSELTLKDGTKFAGIGGVGQATINLASRYSSTLAVLGSGTLDNATIDIGSYYNYSEILNEDTAATGTTLILGPNLTINQTYYNAQLSSTGAAGDAIVNDGIIDVDYAGDLTTNGPGYSNNGNFVLNATNFTNAGSIAVFNDGLLDLTGRISTAVVNSIATSAGGIVGIGGTVTGGTIVAPHGEIGGLGGTLDGVSVQGSLDLSVDNSELTLKDGTKFAGIGGVGQATINLASRYSSTLAVLGSGTLDNATIDIGSYYSDGEILNQDTAATGTTLTLGPNLTINQTYYNAQLSSTGAAGDVIINEGTIDAGFAGGVFSIGANTFTNNGTMSVGNGGSLSIQNTGFNNTGLIILSQGTVASPATSFTNQGTISGFGTILPAIIDNGIIIASGGNLDLKAGDPGTGSGLIDPGATLELGNTFGETITFAAGGIDTLALDSPAYATGTLAGLAPGDTIDFLGTIVSHATITGTTLAVEIGSTTFNYTLAAGLAGRAVVVPDAAGTGSDVRIACFCRGTRIRTPDGEIPVEDLAIGDALVTRRGEARRLIWIGRRSYAGRFAAANPGVRPVCIRAGAIAEGVPKRDLYVSPAHAMYLNHVLVPALALVNGTSIVQVTAFDQVDYVHLELATHDVIFAEGAETESYLDDDNRAMFQNAAEYAALYPALPPAIPTYCAERVEQGPPIAAIRARLAERAVAIGHAPAAFGTQVIRIDQAGLTRAVIAPGVGEVHLVSASGRAGADRRSLGALLLSLAVDGAALPLAAPALLRGFHQVEQHGARQVRWTNGEALLSLPPSDDPRCLTVEVGTVMGQRMAS